MWQHPRAAEVRDVPNAAVPLHIEVLAAGVEAALSPAWALRLDAAYMAFGRSSYAVNRGRNNRCGPSGRRRPCLYEVEHTLSLLRLGFIYRFGR